MTAIFKIPHVLFDLPPATPNVEPARMRDMAAIPPRRRRLVEMQGQLEPPTSGYKEYMLFALRTRLTPELQELVGRSVIISFTGYPAPSLQLTMPGTDKEPHINEQLRREIDTLLQREANLSSQQRLECLILRWNSSRYLTASSLFGTDGLYHRIPKRWLRAILPFLPLDSSLIDDNTIPRIEYRTDGLYADCLNTAAPIGIEDGETYGNLFARMSFKVLELLRRWYDEGRLVDPEQSLIKRWRLTAVRTVGGTTLYKPSDDWGLTRLARGGLLELPVSSLLWELSKGRERTVSIRVGINLVDYHRISKSLFDGGLATSYHFSGGSLHFIPKSLDDLTRVLDGIDSVLYGEVSSGAVVTLTASRLSWIKMYGLIVQRSVSSDIVIYVRRDVEPVFVISFTVPMNADVAALRQEVVLRARRTLVYLLDHMGKPGAAEKTDIHAILDEPDAELPADLSSPTVRSHLQRERPETMPIQF